MAAKIPTERVGEIMKIVLTLEPWQMVRITGGTASSSPTRQHGASAE